MLTLPQALELVTAELGRATAAHGPFNSAHEGWAVILEEVDELWDEVKLRERDDVRMAKEAIQVAAMAIRFITDVPLVASHNVQ